MEPQNSAPHRRRPRYKGTHPRRFEEKYKEHDPAKYSETVAKVLSAGKTPAGTHRPIMVAEILQVLAPARGQTAADCTLGYGGHAEALLRAILPGGRLVGMDADPIELPKTEARLRAAGFGPEALVCVRGNFAGLPHALRTAGIPGVDMILADLGVSSMQLDNPARGFSVKLEGPLDMRMNPAKGMSASQWLLTSSVEKVREALVDNDEPHAALLAGELAGRKLETTSQLRAAIEAVLPRKPTEEKELSIRRTFQAIRIAVNDELSVLDTLLRLLPFCLNPGGRIAFLTFHSGEDRRVKRAFTEGLRAGVYSRVATEPVRPTAEERRSNPRSAPAKLRWAIRSQAAG